MAKLEQGTDVEITTTLSGGRSKHILKLTGPGRAKLVHEPGVALTYNMRPTMDSNSSSCNGRLSTADGNRNP